MDQVIEMCRRAVADIIASVGEVGDLLDDKKKRATVMMILERMDALGADIATIVGPEIAKAYVAGMDEGDAFMQTEGVDLNVGGLKRQVHLSAVQQIVNDTMLDLGTAINTAKELAIENIDTILENVQENIAKGIILGDSSKVVSQAVQQTFAKNGMTSFITSDGKELPLDFYAQTVTRTKMRVAHTNGAVNRYTEEGVTLVKIDEHSGTCAVCARYQGKVVSLSDDDSGFPLANRDVPLPPYHPNCRHTVRPYVIEFHSASDVAQERKKWETFDPYKDVRSQAEQDLYKSEQAIRRKAKQEQREYMAIKSALGDKAPANIGAYRRMKRAGDEKWKELQTQYRDAVEIVDGVGPAKGTPKRVRRAKKVQTETPTTAPAPTPTPQATEETTTPSGLSESVKLTKKDETAIKAFDNMIDGMEFTGDRRKYAKQLIKKSDFTNKDTKVSIKKLPNAWGMVSANGVQEGYEMFMNINSFALESSDKRPAREQLKTMFHEFYHANRHMMPVTSEWTFQRSSEGKKYYTMFEETYTEASAQFMLQRAGYDLTDIVPSYGEYLGRMLPQLKQMSEFEDCVTVADFGAKMMKYRFDPSSSTAEFSHKLHSMQINELEPLTEFEMGKYIVEKYGEEITDNLDYYADRLLNAYGEYWEGEKDERLTYMHGRVKQRMKDAVDNKNYRSRELSTITGVLFNRKGVL